MVEMGWSAEFMKGLASFILLCLLSLWSSIDLNQYESLCLIRNFSFVRCFFAQEKVHKKLLVFLVLSTAESDDSPID